MALATTAGPMHRSKLRRLITSSAGTSSAGGTSTPSVFGRTFYEGLSLKPAVASIAKRRISNPGGSSSKR